MGRRAILDHDQPFGIYREAPTIAGSRYETPAVGAGPSKPTGKYAAKRVQFAGTFAGGWSVDLEGTVDGQNWTIIQALIVAPGVVEVPTWWERMRLRTTVVGNLTSAGSPWGVADQPEFTAYLGGEELIEA